MQLVKYYCDVCRRKETNGSKEKIQVIFTTEQTESRSCVSYLYMATLDICQDCMYKILQGNYLYAQGAMGDNTYYFPEAKKRV
jgi:hypothetical protein